MLNAMQAKRHFMLFVFTSLLAGSLGFDITKAKVRYDDYKVYRVTPDTQPKINLLKRMAAGSDSIIFVDGIHSVQQDVDIIVAAHKGVDLEIILEANEFKFALMSKNLQADFRDFSAPLQFNIYNTLEDANNWLKMLPLAYPGIVTIDTYGMSYEKRELICVKISYSDTKKEAIFVEAGMNGNEWIAPATALYLINELLTSTDPEIELVARNYNWYIIPHVNPDGFEYSHTVDRMWRKTRQPYGDYFGANMNRNFDYRWGKYGSNLNACSIDYIGPRIASETETYDLVTLVLKLELEVKLYISLHAFGQRLEYPLNANSTVHIICGKAIDAIEWRYGTDYICHHKFSLAEKESGNFMDWVYQYRRFSALAYTYKLRPLEGSSGSGFELDENEIVPTAQEFVDSLIGMIAAAETYNHLKPNYSSPDIKNDSSAARPTTNEETVEWEKDELF